MLRQYHNSATTVPQQCYNSATTVLQQCHNRATTMSQQCHNSATTVLQQCHNSATTLTWHMTVLSEIGCMTIWASNNIKLFTFFAFVIQFVIVKLFWMQSADIFIGHSGATWHEVKILPNPHKIIERDNYVLVSLSRSRYTCSQHRTWTHWQWYWY